MNPNASLVWSDEEMKAKCAVVYNRALEDAALKCEELIEVYRNKAPQATDSVELTRCFGIIDGLSEARHTIRDMKK